ncbi:hypothetical protein GCM10009817_02450 [Terrabacter lapilli]|uniref:Uncharacterized protein n=1 Tax=Terrabacter lapilli TaxID=436231 RepID=A0ABN2RAC6_9MICO
MTTPVAASSGPPTTVAGSQLGWGKGVGATLRQTTRSFGAACIAPGFGARWVPLEPGAGVTGLVVGAAVGVGAGVALVGKTLGGSGFPTGTVAGACHGLHEGPATGATCGRAVCASAAEAGETAYAIVRASTSALAAPAATVARGRRREGTGGVIAGTG